MRITVNGTPQDVDGGTTLTRLLHALDLTPKATVVQRNDEIVDRASYDDTVLSEGDVLELVRFVGGG